ncbi:MAG: pyridoxal phosphate-dependent aminotransferase [Prevotella sp.]|nr:pyridoxal phosphate-dependent aminotransferase [Prevotella sp.]
MNKKYNFDERIERRGTRSVKWDETPEGVIPLWVADMDFAVAPAIQEAVRKRAEHPTFGYTVIEDDYYAAIISWFQRRHQWTIPREHILYTTGVVPGISCVIKALTMPGEKVLILSPDYNCFFSCIRNNGCEVSESILRFQNASASDSPKRFEVDYEDFERRCADEKTTVFLLCNPHNPTGRVWTREELQRMSDICRKHHVTIVSDEIHCELTMPGYTFCPMGTVDSQAIVLNSSSKSFNTAGLQIANIICADAELRRRIDRAININEVCDVNPFGPVALMAAYNESEDWIDELNEYILGNYQALCKFVEKEIPKWKVMPLEGTYLAWVDCSACLDSMDSEDREPAFPDVEAYCQHLLNEAKVWLNPGTMYGVESGKGFLRINMACPRSLMMEALERIKEVKTKSEK